MSFFYSQFFVTPKIPTTDVTGQTLIITGSNTGLGFTAAQHIARLKPARLILAVRTQSKGEDARKEIIASIPDFDSSKTEILVWKLDLAQFSSVLAFADKCSSELDRLDGISLNAGIETWAYQEFEGYESTITVNVISTFLLAVAILPKLQESARKFKIQPRLSIVSSEVHVWAPWAERSTPQGQSIIKLMSDPKKNLSGRYMDSKLMEVLIFRHICGLIASKKDNVTLNILNPGFCYSELGRNESRLQTIMRWFLARTQEVGGRPVAAGLVAGPASDGKYMHDGVADDGALSSYATSEAGAEMGKRLWEEMKGVYEDLKPGITKLI